MSITNLHKILTYKQYFPIALFITIMFFYFIPIHAVAHPQELELDLTKKIAAACENDAKSKNINIAIAILDKAGNIKLALRTDNAPPFTINIALLKAKSSATYRASTRALGDSLKIIEGMSQLPELITIPGGQPILSKGGEFYGAVGVSGSSPEYDEQCAILITTEFSKKIR